MEEGLHLHMSVDRSKRPLDDAADEQHPASVQSPDGTCHFDNAYMKDVLPKILKFAANKRAYIVCKRWLVAQLTHVFPPSGKGEREDQRHYGEGLRHALKQGHMKYYRKWKKKKGGWRPGTPSNSYLNHALRRGWGDVVQRLLNMPRVVHRIRLDQQKDADKDRLLLTEAIAGQSVLAVELLLPHVNLAQCGARALNEAAQAGEDSIAKLLIARGVNPTTETLMAACSRQSDPVGLVAYLLRDCGLVVSPAHMSEALQLAARSVGAHTANTLLCDQRTNPTAAAILFASSTGNVTLVMRMMLRPHVDVPALMDGVTLLALLGMDRIHEALTRARVSISVTISSDGSYEYRKSAIPD